MQSTLYFCSTQKTHQKTLTDKVDCLVEMGAPVGVDTIVDWDPQVFGKLVFKADGMMIP